MASFFEKLKRGMSADISSLDTSVEEPEEESPAQKKQKQAVEKKQVAQKKENEKEVSFAVKRRGRPRKQEVAKAEPVAVFAAEAIVPDIIETEETEIEEKAENETKENLEPGEKEAPEIPEKMPEPQKSAEKIVIQSKETPLAQGSNPASRDWPDTEGELVVDIFQTETELVIQSAVAGIKPEDLDIDIEKDILIIKGERKNNDCEKRDYFFQECYWGSFSRQIILPVEVDSSRVKAEMREGVLTVRMPKIIREGKKKINVQSV